MPLLLAWRGLPALNTDCLQGSMHKPCLIAFLAGLLPDSRHHLYNAIIMARPKQTYRCSACGAQTFQWLGQCPNCREWNTLVEAQAPPVRKTLGQGRADEFPIPLAQVESAGHEPYSSGMAALDRVLGAGIVPGSAILVGGEPGIGKSTLLLQVAANVAASGRLAIYASGEESLAQIKGRGERLGALPPSLLALATSRVEDVISGLERTLPQLLVLDSVQTLTSCEADGLPGNVSQVRAVATALVEACRRLGCALILVGHVTKDGTLAGPRLLEHMVDTVIAIEGDRRQMFRLLRVFKNRFGPNEELLVFRMGQTGLELVPDPSTFFLEARDPTLSGTALVMAVDGHRPLAVEVQALVSRTYLAIPRRTALGFDVNRLNLLLAVIEKRLNLNFGQVDIYAKVGGGIRLQEPGIDLAVVAAVLSSYYDCPLPEKSIFWGEVDLNGQIRPAAGHDARLGQATQLGFTPIIFPAGIKDTKYAGKGVPDIMSLQRMLFRKH